MWKTARRLGRLVAGHSRLEPEQLTRSYRALHGAAFARPATPGRQANALMHLAGHLKDGLGSCDRKELREAIEDYRVGLVLRPYPKELGLRGVISKPRGGRSATPTERPKSSSPLEIDQT